MISSDVEIGIVGKARDGHPIIGPLHGVKMLIAAAASRTFEPAPVARPTFSEDERKIMWATGLSEAECIASRDGASHVAAQAGAIKPALSEDDRKIAQFLGLSEAQFMGARDGDNPGEVAYANTDEKLAALFPADPKSLTGTEREVCQRLNLDKRAYLAAKS